MKGGENDESYKFPTSELSFGDSRVGKDDTTQKFAKKRQLKGRILILEEQVEGRCIPFS